jgi:hypothetical protein
MIRRALALILFGLVAAGLLTTAGCVKFGKPG